MKPHHRLPPDDGVYEARYGWDREAAKAIGGCLALCLVAVFVPMPVWASILVAGLFGSGGLLLLALSLLHRPTLRVDASGVTTYLRPLFPRSRRFYPWEDVTAILIWQTGRTTSVGIVRRDGTAPLLTWPLRRSTRAALATGAPGIPIEVAVGAIRTAGWVLRTSHLAAALARFAPGVRVIDTTARRPSRPGRRTARRWRISPWQILWACGVGAAVCFMYLAAGHLGPAIRAAHGQGIHGEWVAEQCSSALGGCIWDGKFVLPDGRVSLPSVTYSGSLTSVYAGMTVPALDSGSGDEVYPVGGSDRWIHDVIGLAGGAVAFVLLIWRAVIVQRRRHRARRELVARTWV